MRDAFDPEVLRGVPGRADRCRRGGPRRPGPARAPGPRGAAAARSRPGCWPGRSAWSGTRTPPTAPTGPTPATRPTAASFITTRGEPTPMESWIAEHLDLVAGLEAARGWSRPITFTNWITVDPMAHPAEPLVQEPLVSVDAMHLRATERWPGGFFASYSAYPYYPDFLRPGAALRGLPPAGRQGRPVRGLPARAARPPRGPGRDDHRVRAADRDRDRPPRAARPRPGRAFRGGRRGQHRRHAVRHPPGGLSPAGSSSSGPTSGSSSPGTRSTSRCPASGASSGATSSPTRSTSASWPPSPARTAAS